MRSFVLLPVLIFLILLQFQLDAQKGKADKECALIIQGWEKPKGYVDPDTGEETTEDEEWITNSTDQAIRALEQYPENVKVTALRPTGKTGLMGGTTYSGKEDFLKKVEAAICDKDCDDVVVHIYAHGAKDGSFGIPDPKNKMKDISITTGDIATIIKKCNTKVKLHSHSCYSGKFVADVIKILGDFKGLVEVGSAAAGPDQCAWAGANGVSIFSDNLLQDYYLIITNPNLMRQIKAEAERLRQKAIKAASEKDEENQKADDKAQAEADKDQKEKAEAEAKATAELLKELEKIKKRLRSLKPPSTYYDKRRDEALALIAKLPPKQKQKAARELIDLLIKKIDSIDLKTEKPPGPINTWVNDALKLMEFLDCEKRLETLKKLKEVLNTLLKRALKNPLTKHFKNIRAHNKVILAGVKKINQMIKDCEAELKAGGGKANAKPNDAKADAAPQAAKPTPPRKTPSTMALVWHYAYQSALIKTKRQMGSQDPQQPKAPVHKDIQFPAQVPINIWLTDLGIGFKFVKVIDTATKKCVIAGFVYNNKLGAFSKISSVKCEMDCSLTEFTYKDEKGKKRKVSIKGGTKPEVTIDGEKKAGRYWRIKVELKRKGEKGNKSPFVQIIFPMGEEPEVHVYKWVKKEVEEKNAEGETVTVEKEVTEKVETRNLKYDTEKKTLTFEMKEGDKWVKVEIKFLPHGGRTIKIGNQKPYHDHLAKNYNMFKGDLRMGHLSLVDDNGDLDGSLWWAAQNQVFNIDGYHSEEGAILSEPEGMVESYIYTEYNSGQADFIAQLNGQSYHFQHLRSSIQFVLKEDFEVSFNELGQPQLKWGVDEASRTPDQVVSGYQLFKFEGAGAEPEVINFNAETTTYTDKTFDPELDITYQLSLALENKTLSDQPLRANQPHYSLPIIVKIERSKKKNKWLIPAIAGGSVVGLVTALVAGNKNVDGCTDPNACNFDPDANRNDGSCLFLDCEMECGGTVGPGQPCDDGDECTVADIWQADCQCAGVSLDSDGDGVCDAEDMCPDFDDQLIGTSCNDGDDCTTNDIWLESCECEGTFLDSDDDGVCDVNDLCPDFDDDLIGTSCDDGDECTTDDLWMDSCECTGTFLDTDGDGICDEDDQCPDFDDNLIGTTCDDGDECTTNDVVLESCECAGTFQDADNDGICDVDDLCPELDDNLIGTNCDDGDECTTNDVWLESCECAGTFQDGDNDGICTAQDCDDTDPGTGEPEPADSPCDDGNEATENDVILEDGCTCQGTPVACPDADNDGICDADDLCPDFDDNLIGTTCDDGDECTTNDILLESCECAGTFQDGDYDGICTAQDCDDTDPGTGEPEPAGSPCDDGNEATENDVILEDGCTCQGTPIACPDADDDGICDAQDLCPDFDDNLISTPCDDGQDCTINDSWSSTCECVGQPVEFSVEITTTNTFCELPNGTATAVVSPAGNYDFVWNSNPGTETVLDLNVGPHTLEVFASGTDCSQTVTFEIEKGTAPNLFEVVNIIPDTGGGGQIVIELNNPYGGDYQVCWNGIMTGTTGCAGPLTNGSFTINGPADTYQLQAEIFNDAPVPCIQIEQAEIPAQTVRLKNNRQFSFFFYLNWESQPIYNGQLRSEWKRTRDPALGYNLNFGLALSKQWHLGLQLHNITDTHNRTVLPLLLWRPSFIDKTELPIRKP